MFDIILFVTSLQPTRSHVPDTYFDYSLVQLKTYRFAPTLKYNIPSQSE